LDAVIGESSSGAEHAAGSDGTKRESRRTRSKPRTRKHKSREPAAVAAPTQDDTRSSLASLSLDRRRGLRRCHVEASVRGHSMGQWGCNAIVQCHSAPCDGVCHVGDSAAVLRVIVGVRSRERVERLQRAGAHHWPGGYAVCARCLRVLDRH